MAFPQSLPKPRFCLASTKRTWCRCPWSRNQGDHSESPRGQTRERGGSLSPTVRRAPKSYSPKTYHSSQTPQRHIALLTLEAGARAEPAEGLVLSRLCLPSRVDTCRRGCTIRIAPSKGVAWLT